MYAEDDNDPRNHPDPRQRRKATHSGVNGGECVEVAPADSEIAVRGSKHPEGPSLSFTPSAWRSFLTRSRGSL